MLVGNGIAITIVAIVVSAVNTARNATYTVVFDVLGMKYSIASTHRGLVYY